MKIYNFSNISKVFFCNCSSGSKEAFLKRLEKSMSKGIETAVHPKEIERMERLYKRKHNNMASMRDAYPKVMSRGNGFCDNSIIFVSGGLGLGTKDDNLFTDLFESINKLASNNNSFVVFIRGCNDNPEYFTTNKMEFSNIVFAEDYSVIKLEGFDCLCVGGGIPIDRQWRIEQEKRFGKKLYFENCNSTFDKECLKEILENNKIAVVVTNTQPTFVSETARDSVGSKWAENDETLIQDVVNQRLVMDGIYGELTRHNNNPYIWCYASRVDDYVFIGGTKYIAASSIDQFYNVNKICEEAFGVQLNGEMPKKELRKIKPRKSYDYAGMDINNPRVMAFDMPTISIDPATYHNFTISDVEQALGTIDAVTRATNE